MGVLGGLSVGELLKRTYSEFNDDDVLSYAAALAYHEVLALFPFLLFLLAVVTFLHVPGLFQGLLGWARTVLPPSGMRQITAVVRGFESSQNGGLLSLGILGAIWAASGGIRSAMSALNRAYDVDEGRAMWKQYLLSIGYTLGLGALVLVAIGILMVGPQAAGWVADRLHIGDLFLTLWTWLRFPVAVALLVVVAALTYSLLPDVKGFRLLTPGSVLAVAVWIGVSIAFQQYVSHFANYNALYGAVGAVIVLLLYFWLSSIALLLGGEVDAVIDTARRRRGEPPDRRQER